MLRLRQALLPGNDHIPEHALHEHILQKQKGVGPLVSSQEGRAAVVPQINRSSIARQPVVVFPGSVYIGLNHMFVPPKKYPGRLPSVLDVRNNKSCPGRTAPPSFCPAPPAPPASPRIPPPQPVSAGLASPRRAAPCPRPPGLVCGMSVF